MYISILITTFNAQRYIVDTLNSLVNQSYKFFEIIIVDDGSTDATLKLIKDYASKHALVKIHIYPISHCGRAAALNHGIERATYEWLAIIDADDLWNVHKLELQTTYIKKFNLPFLTTKASVFLNDTPINLTTKVSPFLAPSKLTKITFKAMLYSNKIAHCSILVRKALVHYNVTRKTQVDYEMYLRFLWQGGEIYQLNETLVYHRLHKHQAFESKKRLSYVTNSILLQLKYCWLSGKIFPGVIVILSIFYHLFSIKKVRVLRDTLLRKKFYV